MLVSPRSVRSPLRLSCLEIDLVMDLIVDPDEDEEFYSVAASSVVGGTAGVRRFWPYSSQQPVVSEPMFV